MTAEMLDFFSVMKKKIPGARFLFISHNDPEEIRMKAGSKGIEEKDILVYAASRTEVPDYLAVSDWSIYFISDVYSKKASSPTKQGEIMGMGIPAICNDIGDTGDIVLRSKAGFVVNQFSEKEYEAVIAKMLDGNTRMPETIRENAFQYYDLQRGVQKYLGIYQQLIV